MLSTCPQNWAPWVKSTPLDSRWCTSIELSNLTAAGDLMAGFVIALESVCSYPGVAQAHCASDLSDGEIPSICADCAPSRKGASRSHGKTGVPGCGRKEDAGTIRNLLAAAEAADSKKERREIFPMTKLRRKKLACRVYGRGRVGGSSCPSPYTGNSTQSSTAQRPLG